MSNENSIISQNNVSDKSNLIYVRKIIVNQKVIILFLSDKTIEAFFSDKIKILMSDTNDKIQIMDQNNKINVISRINVFQNDNHDFIFRLKMIKNVTTTDIRDRASENIKENNQNQINNES